MSSLQNILKKTVAGSADIFKNRELVKHFNVSKPHYGVIGPGGNYVEFLRPLTDPAAKVTVIEMGTGYDLLVRSLEPVSSGGIRKNIRDTFNSISEGAPQLLRDLGVTTAEDLVALIRKRVTIVNGASNLSPGTVFDVLLMRNPFHLGNDDIPRQFLRSDALIVGRTEAEHMIPPYLRDPESTMRVDIGSFDFGYMPPEIRQEYPFLYGQNADEDAVSFLIGLTTPSTN